MFLVITNLKTIATIIIIVTSVITGDIVNSRNPSNELR
jgi:hypothetical protein